MCGKGGGSPPVPSGASTSFQSTVSPAAFATPLYQDFLNRANSLSTTPFNAGMYGQVAALNPTQAAGITGISNLAAGAPALGSYMQSVGQNLGSWDPAAVRAIESPYTEDVVNATQNWFNNQNAIQGNDLLSQAIRSGNAFGGDRAGVAEGVLAGQQQLAQAPVIAGLRQAGYGQALDEYNKLKQFGATGAQMALQGWDWVKNAQLAGLGVGTMMQQQQQREFDVAQQNAMMSSAYPFQTLNWYGAILGGIAPLLGSQAVGFNTPPAPGGAGFKRGGMVLERRKQGGLVPVFVRHNGGIIAGLAYGGSPDDDSDEDKEKRQAEPESRDVSTSGSQETPEPAHRERPASWGSEIGQLQTTGRGAPPQAQFASGTPQQPQSTMSQISEGVGTLGKIIDVGAKVAPFLAVMSDPKTKTDVQRVGKTDGGDPLYAFRYRGDPKTYPKVVGPMARPMGGMIPRPRRYDDGGEILSDESEYPVEPGQQYARDYAGRTTWFNPKNEVGGWTYRDPGGQDWTDWGAKANREGYHASGLPSTVRGFASPGRDDLGNWFELNLPGGRKTYAQKTDIGPEGVIDLNAPLAASEGYSPNTVPSGRTYARDLGRSRPPEAAYAQAAPADTDPAAAKAAADKLPLFTSPEARQPGPVERRPAPSGGSAQPDPAGGGGVRTGPSPGMGPVGGRIPNAPSSGGVLGGITDVAKEGLRNPLVQLVGGYLSGTSPWGRVNLGNALLKTAGIQAQQREADRRELLDQKPELIHTEKGMAYKYPDGTITHLGMKGATQSLAERKQQASEATPFEVEETRGDGLFESKVKVPYVIDPNDPSRVIPFQPQGAQPQAQPQQQAPAPARPAAPQAPPTGVGGAPIRQTEAQQPPPAGGGTGAAPISPQPQQPQIVQVQRPPDVSAATGPTAKPPADSYEGGWGGVMPIGTVTNPAALAASRNEDALARANPQQANLIKGIVDYKIDPKSIPMRDPKTGVTRAQWLEAALAYDPAYNAGMYPARAQALKEFGVNGMAQKSLQSNSMVLEHLGDAMTAVDNLGNTTVPKYNYLTGKWQFETGNEKYQAAAAAVNTTVHAAAAEAARTFRGVGAMSVREQEIWNQILLGTKEGEIPSASPVTMRSALKELTGLVTGRLNATAQGYNQIMGPAYQRDGMSFMTPKAKETLQRSFIDPQENAPFPPSKFEKTQPDKPAKPLQQGQGPDRQQQPQQQLSPQDQQAVDWARKNPQHPRSREILQRNGLQ